MADEPRPRSWWETVPGALTAIGTVIAAVTGLIVALRDGGDRSPAPAPTVPAASSRQTVIPTGQPDLSGTWRDNWGTIYQLTQDGPSLRFTAQGTSCRGVPFNSSGSGTVIGNQVETSYQSSVASRGTCSATVSPDGRQMTSRCTDSLCGTFAAVVGRP